MFFENQSVGEKEKYQNFLQLIGCLSNLFSDSKVPYLYYRVAEKLFCRAFNAEDLSRSDVSADAKKEDLGIGLKTFLAGNNETFQKIAEFNSDRSLYVDLSPRQLVKKISELRNERIAFTKNIHNLDQSIYHCVIRDTGRFKIYEEIMNIIDINNIQNVRNRKGSITFNDNVNEYSFLKSKSTLTKRFHTRSFLHEFDINILKDPIEELKNLLVEKDLEIDQPSRIKNTIYLPLYGNNKRVFERSGLNQWNAGGRKRHQNEVYINIPKIIHQYIPNFFPDRDKPFSLKLPNGETIRSKICQDSGKALMSHSNKKLGQWILRDVLKLNEGELLTYAKLQVLGVDSVRIDKISNREFEINFAKINSFEEFKKNLN